MSSRIVILFYLLQLVHPAIAQNTIHAFFATNPYQEEDIFYGCQSDRARTIFFLRNMLNSVSENEVPQRLKVYNLTYDAACIPEEIASANVDSTDGVIFIHSGHGVLNVDEPLWPLLYYCRQSEASPDASTACALTVETIRRAVRAHGPRMSLIVLNACNNDPRMTVEEPVYQPQFSLQEAEADNTEFDAISLLTRYKGHVVIASASPGQKSYTGDQYGSPCLRELWERLADNFYRKRCSTWSDLLRPWATPIAHTSSK